MALNIGFPICIDWNSVSGSRREDTTKMQMCKDVGYG